ncbi:PREDICTED: non-structural maintenance of chromosomes element 4 homolog A-like [Vollenhovia emeryi]|uniref:non-structural maintenance of chromosomes element 4 homolog A-like n=1 Tax=Vollenhovia emeryi TaxID=411798 RepID=UPI0005F5213C|nr:PREDICTED: non-structural maintenance of chromosomes element 4 homolog A-like [Vollenhovia emeryi]
MLNNKNSTDFNSFNTRSSKERKNCLKRALQQTLVLQEVVNNSTINKLDEAINQVDRVTYETSIQEKVSNQQEVFIDSQMMTSSSKVLKMCTVSLAERMSDYDYVDFSQKLVKHLQGTSGKAQSPNWSLLERRVTKLFKKIANSNTLLGTLDPLEKKTIVRKKPEQRALQAAMTVPEKVANANAKDEDSVERTVTKIKKLITCYCKETGKSLDFFQLILHPHDFGKTIRNMLYISFLVKDGVIKLKKDRRSLVVQPSNHRKETNSQEKRSGNRINIQNVTALNMKLWRILKKAYRLEQAMINFDEGK